MLLSTDRDLNGKQAEVIVGRGRVHFGDVGAKVEGRGLSVRIRICGGSCLQVIYLGRFIL